MVRLGPDGAVPIQDLRPPRFNPTMVRLGLREHSPADWQQAGFNPTMVRLGLDLVDMLAGTAGRFNPTMVRLGPESAVPK